MKKLIAVVVLASASMLAFAEPPGKGQGRWSDELDLTAEQRQQLQEIRDSGGGREEMRAVLTPEQREQADELRGKHKQHRARKMEHMKETLDLSEEQAEQMREIRESGGSRDDIRAVLTTEQQEKFDEMRKHRKKGKQRPEQ